MKCQNKNLFPSLLSQNFKKKYIMLILDFSWKARGPGNSNFPPKIWKIARMTRLNFLAVNLNFLDHVLTIKSQR
jgi:hypothetical protein